MNFQQWCESTGMEETRIVKHDMVSMCILKECWDYQQEKIQILWEALTFYDNAHRLNHAIDLNRLKTEAKQALEKTE